MSRYRAIKNLQKLVLAALEASEKSRNSDALLTLTIWKRYYPNSFIEKDGAFYVRARDILDALPREDQIGRIRRKVQESGKFFPTDEKIAKQRKLNMDEWRVAMGYPTRASAGTDSPSWTPPSEVINEQLQL